MKKQRKPVKVTGASIFDEQGNKVPINPKEIEAIANSCAAVAKTIETGVQHRVIA